MNWITWAALLIAWPLVALSVAYLFGWCTREVESPENADGLVSPVVSYLRHKIRAKTPARATSPTKARREGADRRLPS